MIRRKVFFISGFDPKGPAFYHQLFTDNAAKQSALSNMQLDVSARKRCGKNLSGWKISALEDGEKIATDYVFCRWDDLIARHYWPRGSFNLFGQMLKAYWHHIRSGFLLRTYANAWPTFIAGSFPATVILACVLTAFFAGLAIAGLGLKFFGYPVWLAIIAAAASGAGAIKYLTPMLDKKMGVYWLIRIYIFLIPQAGGKTTLVNERFRGFAEQVVKAAKSGEYDEVLIVGHSTGAQAAVSILAMARDIDPDFSQAGTNVSLLTLGSSIPMLSWQRQAGWFRAQLKAVANMKELAWVDFTAAQDGACFALFDPVENSGLKHRDPKNPSPKLLSIKLFELYSKNRFQIVRRNWFQIHFQYLSAGEKLGSYDYFAIVGGGKTLADRFSDRQSTSDFNRFRSRLLARWAASKL